MLKPYSLMAVLLMLSLSAMGAEHSVGTGKDDWWASYPDDNTNAGGSVNHPAWVLNALKERPVLIFVHLNCDYCAPQKEAVDKVMQDYSGDVTLFDLAGDSDARAADAIVYDPDGGKALVPLTVVVTLVNDDGDVRVGWHSSEDITGEDWIRSYLDDAIALYNENRGGWAGA
ncbi:MAG TPA: thioredoxin family protein [Methanothrix sp.]|nr:thioredoxin family protein [Methanothrix sp.]HPO88054.1 thioredoxin family protein [Methanothrix sp.]